MKHLKFINLLLIGLLMAYPAIAKEFIELNIETKNNTVSISSDNGDKNTFHCDRESEYNFLVMSDSKTELEEFTDTLQLQKEVDNCENQRSICEEKADDLELELEKKKSEIVALNANKTIMQTCDERIGEFNKQKKKDITAKDAEIEYLEEKNKTLLITEILLFIITLGTIIVGVVLYFKNKNKGDEEDEKKT